MEKDNNLDSEECLEEDFKELEEETEDY